MRLFSSSRALLFSLSLLALAAVPAGCGSSRAPATAHYQAVQDKMVYRARDISLGTMFPTGGMSRDPRVALQSWATCSGENCQPQNAWFSFLLRGNANRSRILTNRRVEIQADEKTHTWPEQRQRFAGDMSSSHSELTRISMKTSTLRQIAQAQAVSGTLGGEKFSLSYEERAPLRVLLDRMTADDSSE